MAAALSAVALSTMRFEAPVWMLADNPVRRWARGGRPSRKPEVVGRRPAEGGVSASETRLTLSGMERGWARSAEGESAAAYGRVPDESASRLRAGGDSANRQFARSPSGNEGVVWAQTARFGYRRLCVLLRREGGAVKSQTGALGVSRVGVAGEADPAQEGGQCFTGIERD